jgi:hypothetical protein
MKTFLLASIAVLALTATADARHVYHYSLCTPAQKQTGERDPVTSIVIERYGPTLFDAKFRFASGKSIKRSDEYNIESDDDGWHGTSIKWPNLVMHLTLAEGPGYTSEYIETLRDLKTGQIKFITAAHCRGVAPHEVGEVDDSECSYKEGNACQGSNP